MDNKILQQYYKEMNLPTWIFLDKPYHGFDIYKYYFNNWLKKIRNFL